MPPLKEVNSLQKLAAMNLSSHIAKCVTGLANGSYVLSKSIGTGKKDYSDYKLSVKPTKHCRPVLLIPTKEIHKIKTYIGQGIPTSERTEMFHNVLKQVTEMILTKQDLSRIKSFKFSERVAHLDEGFMYIFSILLDKEITKLDFTTILHITMKWIDTCRLNNANPKDENFNYTKVENIFLKHLAENAKYMGSVISLCWPHLISGELIRLIGRHLKNLRTLILACSCETGPFIEEERKGNGTSGCQQDLILSLESLFSRAPGDFIPTVPSGCPKLKKLTLPNLDDEEEKGAVILANALRNLSHLEFVSGMSILSSLAILYSMQESPSRLVLKNINDYDPYKRRQVPEVGFLKELLPRLESIELRVSKDLTHRIIKQFPNIQELSIEWPEFHIHVKDFVCLTNLNISLDFHSPWPLLLVLTRCCKDLKRLTLEHSTFKIDTEGMENVTVIPRLPNLEFFRLIRSSFIEYAAFKTFISGCPDLTELYISLSNDRNYMVDEFTDQLIRVVAPYLKSLKKFTVECLYKYNMYLHVNCVLTLVSVNILLAHCPALAFIGHLDSWDISDREIKELCNVAKTNNWDLELAT